jgi:6-phosphogluconolactonase (cycloisomerase 2 family)
MQTRHFLALGSLAFAAACSTELPVESASTTAAAEAVADASLSSLHDEDSERLRGPSAGAVYTLSNQASGNEVMVFPRSGDGSLANPIRYPTGGTGSGGGLGNQGAVILSDDGRWLIAVNAGSNDVSVFRVRRSGLDFVGRTASGGEKPISLTLHHDLLYVLNDGGTANISGFRLDDEGQLTPIPGSARPLSIAAPDAAQVKFSPDGGVLVVTEKATNLIVTYRVNHRGLAGEPQPQASAGQTPFGSDFDPQGRLLVSEAFGGASDASATSSYRVLPNGRLRVISASVGTTETANCWVVVTRDGRFAYVTNTGSGTVSGYSIGRNGELSLLGDGQSAVTGPGTRPIDAALTRGSRFLYVLNSGNATVSGFRVGPGGSLEGVGTTANLPTGANGLAAW